MQIVINRKSKLNINSSIIQVVKISRSVRSRVNSLFCLHSLFNFFKTIFLKYFLNYIPSSQFYEVIHNSMGHRFCKYLLSTRISCVMCDT